MSDSRISNTFVAGAWRAARATALVGIFVLVPATARAQRGAYREPLKPGSIAAPPRAACSAIRATGSPTDEQRRRARDLMQRGQQAAILGDSPSALRELRDASLLDPTDPDLAYQLARAYETAKDAANAAKEYCRFLALSPTAPEAGEVVEKVRILAPPTVDLAVDSALVTFRSGIAAYERGQMSAAETAFTAAIVSDSMWADAFYNRGQVRLARNNADRARVDLEQYLKLKPEADDRARVVAQIAALAGPRLSSFQAFALGVIVPGGGQFYAHRPIRGVLTIAAVGAAIGFGMVQESSTFSTPATATDPFGQTYTYTATRIKTERPNLVVGIGAAAGIAALSALNAAWYAHSSGDDPRRLGFSFVPGANVLVAHVSLLTR